MKRDKYTNIYTSNNISTSFNSLSYIQTTDRSTDEYVVRIHYLEDIMKSYKSRDEKDSVIHDMTDGYSHSIHITSGKSRLYIYNHVLHKDNKENILVVCTSVGIFVYYNTYRDRVILNEDVSHVYTGVCSSDSNVYTCTYDGYIHKISNIQQYSIFNMIHLPSSLVCLSYHNNHLYASSDDMKIYIVSCDTERSVHVIINHIDMYPIVI